MAAPVIKEARRLSKHSTRSLTSSGVATELREFQKHDIPIVAVDRRVKDRTTDAVLVDNVRGACEGVTHLITNGYRRIAIVTGSLSTTTGRERLEGYRKALDAAAITHDPLLERFGSFQEESGKQLTNELLNLNPPIDALFTANNLMTIGALEAIQKRNLRIPEDMAIVGFDEMPGRPHKPGQMMLDSGGQDLPE